MVSANAHLQSFEKEQFMAIHFLHSANAAAWIKSVGTTLSCWGSPLLKLSYLPSTFIMWNHPCNMLLVAACRHSTLKCKSCASLLVQSQEQQSLTHQYFLELPYKANPISVPESWKHTPLEYTVRNERNYNCLLPLNLCCLQHWYMGLPCRRYSSKHYLQTKQTFHCQHPSSSNHSQDMCATCLPQKQDNLIMSPHTWLKYQEYDLGNLQQPDNSIQICAYGHKNISFDQLQSSLLPWELVSVSKLPLHSSGYLLY